MLLQLFTLNTSSSIFSQDATRNHGISPFPVTRQSMFMSSAKMKKGFAPKQILLRSPKQILLRSPKQILLRSPKQILLRSPKQILLRSPKQILLRSSKQILLRSPKQILLRSSKQILLYLSSWMWWGQDSRSIASRRDCRKAPADETAASLSLASPIRRTNALPTTTPSAILLIRAASSGVEIPNPTTNSLK